MTILVTGSSGHLGEGLMRTLRARGESARGLDIKPSAFTDSVGTICDRDFVRGALKGVRHVVHSATLHKPHIATHPAQAFLDTNVNGTLVLLEEAVAAGIETFVFTSTTSAFGSALTPGPGEPTTWITEDVKSVPRNIYGVTKTAAEDICELFHRKHGLPVIILRTSRFFPEPDDDPVFREKYASANAHANELLYRRGDIADMVEGHLLAIGKARALGFGRYILSATTPFSRSDCGALRHEADRVVKRLYPDCEALYAARGWSLFPGIDRVYDNARACGALGWRPRYDFGHVLDCLRRGRDFRSPLAVEIGIKGYHGDAYADGIYPVA